MYYLSDICSMCLLRNQNLKSFLSKDVDGTVVEEKVKIFLLELIHFKPSVTKYICKNCLDNINYIYKFRLKCLKNITLLDEYVKELELHKPKKSLLVSLLSDTNEKDDSLELLNQNKNKICENKIQNNCPLDKNSVETVFIKDEIEETNNVLHETTNIMEESNQKNSQDDIKSEITEIRQNPSENIVKEENENINNSEVTYDVFSKFNEDEKSSDEDDNTNSSDILTEANDCENIEEPPQNKFSCTECDKTYATSSALKKHTRVHSKDRPFDLSSCKTKKPRRKKASVKKEKKRHECSECHKIWKNENALIKHFRTHTNERPFKCTVCEKSFKQKSALQEHISIHTGNRTHICDKCGLTFYVNSHLVRHINTVHHNIRNFKCDDCGKGFTKTSDLNNHMRIHSGVKPFKCDICDRSFTLSHTLKLHSRTHREGTNPDFELEKKHVCVVCQKRFFILTDLKRHMVTHSDERPHECTVCHKSFKLPAVLKEHMSMHTGEKPYMCNVCGLTCYTKSHLLRHIRVVHNNIREFKCQDCNKAFAKPSDLERHSRIHKGIRPFKCTLCEKSFTMANTLKVHSRIHLRKVDDSKPEKEKKFECEVCQKKFSTTRLLRRHGLTHSTEGTPHKCQTCEKSFKLRTSLKKHERSKHPDKADA